MWPTFYGGLMAWLGWFLLAIFLGIGMAALPLDLILKFTQRPKRMDAVEFAACNMSIQQRVNELVDIGEQLKMERDEKKQNGTTSSSGSGGGLFNRKARKEKNEDKQTLKALKQAVICWNKMSTTFKPIPVMPMHTIHSFPTLPLFSVYALVISSCGFVNYHLRHS